MAGVGHHLARTIRRGRRGFRIESQDHPDRGTKLNACASDLGSQRRLAPQPRSRVRRQRRRRPPTSRDPSWSDPMMAASSTIARSCCSAEMGLRRCPGPPSWTQAGTSCRSRILKESLDIGPGRAPGSPGRASPSHPGTRSTTAPSTNGGFKPSMGASPALLPHAGPSASEHLLAMLRTALASPPTPSSLEMRSLNSSTPTFTMQPLHPPIPTSPLAISRPSASVPPPRPPQHGAPSSVRISGRWTSPHHGTSIPHRLA